jgi:hypothetical protein
MHAELGEKDALITAQVIHRERIWRSKSQFVVTLPRSSAHPGAGTMATVANLLDATVARLFSSSFDILAPVAST